MGRNMRWKKRQLEEQFPEAPVMAKLTRGLNVRLPGATAYLIEPRSPRPFQLLTFWQGRNNTA